TAGCGATPDLRRPLARIAGEGGERSEPGEGPATRRGASIALMPAPRPFTRQEEVDLTRLLLPSPRRRRPAAVAGEASLRGGEEDAGQHAEGDDPPGLQPGELLALHALHRLPEHSDRAALAGVLGP